MTQENRISFSIPADDLAEVMKAIKVLQDKLVPRLVTLSIGERHNITKMGNKNTAFIKKCKEFLEQNPSMAPPFIDIKEMQIDIDAVDLLRSVLNPISQISSAIDDSMMLSGSEAYISALAFYHNVKGATRVNVPGAKNVFEELRKQFVKKSNNNSLNVNKTAP